MRNEVQFAALPESSFPPSGNSPFYSGHFVTTFSPLYNNFLLSIIIRITFHGIRHRTLQECVLSCELQLRQLVGGLCSSSSSR
uniref:Uncharacterized protein n=1 Tax=Onchocerca volvulus TaxID=6282 RepID=A0A8R1TJG5_ONCVO